MKWIQASERLPDIPGRYFVKTDRQQMPSNGEKNQVATFTTHKEWYLENHHHSHDFFWITPFEWLDESPSSTSSLGREGVPHGVKLCDCPECGAEIQYGLAAEVIDKFKNSKLFNRTPEDRMFTLEEMKDTWEAAVDYEFDINYGHIPTKRPDKKNYFKEKLNIDL